ncbi:pyridoxamine 5'-phosphate oxidase family protein [Nakamurella sp.]|uniref:pyridoxamine 5'-phosphate oxidase family protein n=1 Tax=Nakamurella sp. TaxID=1869182 RepID=UPI003B3BC9D7
MGQVFAAIDGKLQDWIDRQHMFFVATAPSGSDGLVNLSPKGMGGTFAVLDPTHVGYLDYTGSGAETIAHLRDNGRIVVMFCAFDGPPRIVRLHGHGRVVRPGAAEFDPLRARFGKPATAGQRAIVVIELTRISDSCGFSIPLMDFRADRDVLDRVHRRNEGEHGEQYFHDYWARKNAVSVDGLPALEPDPGPAATG